MAYVGKRDYEDSDERDEKIAGFDLNYDWELTPRMSLLIGAGVDRREEDDTGSTDDLWTATVGLQRQLRENMNLELEGGSYQRNSDDEFDYTDNFGTLRFNVVF